VELDPNPPDPFGPGTAKLPPVEHEDETTFEREVRQVVPPADGPCEDCAKDQRTTAMIGMGIGIIVGAAAVYILTKPRG
jgi:hypothetical protein